MSKAEVFSWIVLFVVAGFLMQVIKRAEGEYRLEIINGHEYLIKNGWKPMPMGHSATCPNHEVE